MLPLLPRLSPRSLIRSCVCHIGAYKGILYNPGTCIAPKTDRVYLDEESSFLEGEVAVVTYPVLLLLLLLLPFLLLLAAAENGADGMFKFYRQTGCPGTPRLAVVG